MQVKDLMHGHVMTCKTGDTLAVAGQVFGQVGVGVLPVVDEQRKVVGIVTDRDLFLALATRNARPSDLAVGEIMRTPVYTCSATDGLLDALDEMRKHGVRRLPVLGDDGRIEGILSLDDVVVASQAEANRSVDESYGSAIIRTLRATIKHRQSPAAALRAVE